MAERFSEQVQRLQDKVKLLQGDLELYMGISDELEKRVQEMTERAEESFLNSPTYRQMQMRMEFLEASLKSKEEHVKSMGGLRFRAAEAARQVYEDNQKLVEDAGNSEYFVGITRGTDGQGDQEGVRETVDDLKGRLEAANDLLAERDGEIERLRGNVADLEARLRQGHGKMPGKPRRNEAVMGRAR